MYIVVGLGNPGKEYEETRHNTGRLALEYLSSKDFFSQENDVRFAHLDTFMNRSGDGVAKFIKNKEEAKKLIVIYDDLDLPLGSLRVSYDRGSGGHNGVESIIKSLGTREFVRIRVGIAPKNFLGHIKKPKGEQKVQDFILGKFSKREMEILDRVFERVAEAIRFISSETLQGAMTKINRQG